MGWHTLEEDFVKFPNISWQRVAEVDSLWQEKADGSNSTIVPFVTSDDSRPDNEMCWLFECTSLTNPPDSVILSPNM